MVTFMKKLRFILALLCCVSFASRAAAQWTIIDLDDFLSRYTQSDQDGCCCDDEGDPDAPDDDCCDEPCDNTLPCHHHCCDLALPGGESGALPAPCLNTPVIFQVSRPVADGWRLGLERPPCIA